MKISLELLREKQGSQTKRHDGIKESFQQHREGMKELFSKMEKRLHALEDFMLASLQRLAFIKTLFKFWPVLVATLLFFFSVGIFVDDQKVATEIADKLELKK
jgi:hypothetical protein